ncbi:Coenzyme F420 hydrogenase/dehydrogenase, beta subunit C-terminal domain [Rhodobacteraceae bacterium NNCM2]|nr:Coenzyme F420 hydrogenase/dehydrogenase, beta subunit C-terminal domain [Coraliihabitans acroporae]
MTGFTRLDQIVESGYCLSCGLCTGLIEDGAVSMALTEGEQLRPVASRPLTEAEEARIVRLCPGVSLSGPFAAPLTQPDPVWGEALRVAEGWAADPEVRFRASAGGIMTTVNRYLLETEQVDFVLQVRAGGPDALSSEPVMVRDPDELLTGSQSRYAPSAPLTALQEALATGERFAVSLKPCDVAAVRNLQREDARAREQIAFTMAMFCGTVPSRETTWEFFRRRDVDPRLDPPVAMRWRGDGCPGAAVGTMADGRTLRGTYQEMWVENRSTTQFRCKICPDAVGLQADLATGDCWPDAVPEGETPGESAIIAHTQVGLDVLNACEADGRLVLEEREASYLSATQPHHDRLRRTWATRVAAAYAAGLPMPSFTDLAAAEAAASLDPADLAETFRGTLERVRRSRPDACAPSED